MIDLTFQPFDERRAVKIYRRNLPHWRQEGATYFVTFRLADSIPKKVRDELEFEKKKWLETRGINNVSTAEPNLAVQQLSRDDRRSFHRHFNRQTNACLDRGLGECHLADPRVRETVTRQIEELENSALSAFGDYVIMPNHVHLLMLPAKGWPLENVLKRLKGATSVKCNRILNRTGTFWQADSYDHLVRNLDQLMAFRNYIWDNPCKAALSDKDSTVVKPTWIQSWFDNDKDEENLAYTECVSGQVH